jgi:hypothetical protein
MDFIILLIISIFVLSIFLVFYLIMSFCKEVIYETLKEPMDNISYTSCDECNENKN